MHTSGDSTSKHITPLSKTYATTILVTLLLLSLSCAQVMCMPYAGQPEVWAWGVEMLSTFITCV